MAKDTQQPHPSITRWRKIATFSLALVVIFIIPFSLKRNRSASSQAWSRRNQENQTQTSTLSNHCSIKEINIIDDGEGGGFSPDGQTIVYEKRDENNYYQLWTSNVDGANKKCLTCNSPAGAPPLDKHKGAARFHPSGKYIYFVAGSNHFPGADELATPGTGWWVNLWMVTVDGSQWYQLTDYSTSQASESNPTGMLHPQFSADGNRVIWSERIGDAKPVKTTHLAKWRLAVAEFDDRSGTPRLLNKQTLSPGNGTFYETHPFNPTNRDEVLFSADIGRSTPYPGNKIDIFKYNLVTKELTNLTDSDDEWDEHAIFSPNGRQIAWGSSQFNKWYNPEPLFHRIPPTLKLEVYLMDADGANKIQLTHVNTKGDPAYHQQSHTAFPHDWSPDGTKLSGTQQLNFPDRRVWVLTFNGACGMS